MVRITCFFGLLDCDWILLEEPPGAVSLDRMSSLVSLRPGHGERAMYQSEEDAVLLRVKLSRDVVTGLRPFSRLVEFLTDYRRFSAGPCQYAVAYFCFSFYRNGLAAVDPHLRSLLNARISDFDFLVITLLGFFSLRLQEKKLSARIWLVFKRRWNIYSFAGNFSRSVLKVYERF